MASVEIVSINILNAGKDIFSGGQKLLSEIEILMILRILSMMDGKTTAPLKGLIAILSSVPNAKK